MTRTYDLTELKGRSIFTCVVSEHGYDLLCFSAFFRGRDLLRVECDNICPSRASLAVVADEQRRFVTNLQAWLYGSRTIEDLKILSKKINLPCCDTFVF